MIIIQYYLSWKVDKDDYILRAHVRHEKKEILDKMMDIPLSMSFKVICRKIVSSRDESSLDRVNSKI